MVKIQPPLCAVCYQVCDTVNGVAMHGTEVTGSSDHPAVPIPYDDARVRTKCDFCGQEDVSKAELYAFPAKDFPVPVIGSISKGAWAACATCADLIKDEDWTTIIERAVAGTEHQPENEEMLRAWLVMLYEALKTNQTENIRPWRAGDEMVED